MTKNSFFSGVLTLIFSILLFSCNRPDESFPDLSSFLIELSPDDGGSFVPTHAKMKAIIQKINHEHTNDLGKAYLFINMSLYSNGNYIEGEVMIVPGDNVDTVVMTTASPLSAQQEYQLNFRAFWKIDEHSAYGEEVNVTHLFETIPASLPGDALRALYPDNGSTGISVMAQPSAEFIYPINKELTYRNNSYKYLLKKIQIREGGNTIEGQTVWNIKNDQLIYLPDNNLPSNAEITIDVETQLYIKASGSWQEAKASVVNTYSFSTNSSTSAILITDDEVDNSYPIARQYNFYKDEYEKGYLKLKTTYSWLNDAGVDYAVEFSDQEEVVAKKTAVFSNENRCFEYNLPGNLKNNTIYKIELKRGAGTIYQYHFKTSNYNTFSEKMAALSVQSRMMEKIYYNGVFCIAADLVGDEHFDSFELAKAPFKISEFTIYKSTGLIQCEADLTDDWYQQKTIKAVYDVLGSGDMVLNYRDDLFFDIPPARAVYLSCSSETGLMLSDDEIASNEIVGFSEFSSTKVMYDQNLINYADYYELLNRIANMEESEKTADMEYILMHSFPSILGANDYTINAKLNYVIPCVNEISSTVEMVILN